MAEDPLPVDACLVWDLDGTLVAPGRVDPVPGVLAVVRAWHARGAVQAVATSASTRAAREVVDSLGVADCFTHVAGTAPGVSGKAAVVAEALLGVGRPLPDGARGAVLIGDSASDVHAARELGLSATAVSWGRTPGAELAAAGADRVVDDPEDLRPAGGA